MSQGQTPPATFDKLEQANENHMLYGKGIWTAVKGGFRSNFKKATIGGAKTLKNGGYQVLLWIFLSLISDRSQENSSSRLGL
jgi:hypothetical protein